MLLATLAFTQPAIFSAWVRRAGDRDAVHRAAAWIDRSMQVVLMLLAAAITGWLSWEIVTVKPEPQTLLYVLFYIALLYPLVLGLRVGLAPFKPGVVSQRDKPLQPDGAGAPPLSG